MVNKGDLRVWWSSYLPIREGDLETYSVKNLNAAKEQIDFLSHRDLRDKFVTDNVGGLEIFNGDDWEEWSNEDGENIDDIELDDVLEKEGVANE